MPVGLSCLAECLVRTRYDVSRGYAKWLPGALLGQDLEGRHVTGVPQARAAEET